MQSDPRSTATDITFDDLERAFADMATPEPAGGDAILAPVVTVPSPRPSPASDAPPRIRVTQLASPYPARPTRTLRAHVTAAYVEPWPPPVPEDDVWPESPRGGARLVVVLKLGDDTTAHAVTYGSPIRPDQTLDGLRAFGWRGERDAQGQPTLQAVELDVVVQLQFVLGFGEVATVLTVSVVEPDGGLDPRIPQQRGTSTPTHAVSP
jgi:hypothetical protein